MTERIRNIWDFITTVYDKQAQKRIKQIEDGGQLFIKKSYKVRTKHIKDCLKHGLCKHDREVGTHTDNSPTIEDLVDAAETLEADPRVEAIFCPYLTRWDNEWIEIVPVEFYIEPVDVNEHIPRGICFDFHNLLGEKSAYGSFEFQDTHIAAKWHDPIIEDLQTIPLD